MSETPTNYDLVQDARIGPMEQILSQAAEPPTGAEFSYPVVGQGWSTEMWQWITKGVGNGIIDLGNYGYWLRNNGSASNTNSTNTMLLTRDEGTANAIVEGFYHQMSSDMTLSFPMPSSGTVTYHVCLTYDPREQDTGGGPISVQVYAGTPPTTFGRVHVILWSVRRRSSELLTDAVLDRYRPRISPVIYVRREDQKPPPAQQLFGSLCVVGETGDIWHNDETGGQRAWINLTSPNWVKPGYSELYQHPGHGHQIARKRSGRTVSIRGRMSRAGGTPFYPGNDYWIMTLPDGWKPSAEHRFRAPGHGFSPNNEAVIHVTTTGEVRAYPQSTMSWIGIDGVQWDTE